MIIRIFGILILFAPLFLFTACGSKTSTKNLVNPTFDSDLDKEACIALLSAITDIPEDEVRARYATKLESGTSKQIRLRVEVSDGPEHTYNCFVQP